jgi:hypothetical protein
VTSADTVSDVFHLALTLSLSTRKNTVAATIAMEIIQNDTPTKSFDFKSPAIAKDGISATVNTGNMIDNSFFI